MSNPTNLRSKLSDLQKETIIEMSKDFSISELARYYNVSRRTIQFVVFPERKRASDLARKTAGKSYYNKEKQMAANKKYLKLKKENSK